MSLRPFSALAAVVAGLLLMVCGWSTASADVGSRTRPLRVMTYNIRYDDGKAAHAWDDRLPVMADLLHAANPDLLGVQEALHDQMIDLAEALPGYAWVGEGREGGEDGEYMGIFYRTDRLQAKKSGNFWLSDTPDVPGSATWGNHIPRMVTWVLFQDRRTHRLFYHYNTHFDCDATCGDTVGNEVRLKSAKLITQRTRHSPHPVILTGDFNSAATTSDPYKYLTAPGRFADTWQDAGRRGPIVGTFNNYSDPKIGGDRIDWMLHRGKINTIKSTIDTTGSADGNYPSDHLPVISDVVVGQSPTGPVPDHRAPRQVHGVTAKVRANAVDLAWQPASDNIGVESYNIYGSKDPKVVPSRRTLLSHQASLTFFDRDLSAGDTWYFRVAAVDRRGNVGPPSPALKATTQQRSYLFEGESLLPTATSAVEIEAQPNCCDLSWSAGHQLLVYGAAVGDGVSATIVVPQDGRYELTVDATKASDFANWQVSIDGTAVGQPVNAYAKTVTLVPDIAVGAVDLTAGEHTIAFTAVGHDQASKNYRIGIDAFVLTGRDSARHSGDDRRGY